MPDCDVSTWRRKGTHTFLDSFRLADALSMLDTTVTFQDGAEKVLTLFSIRSACRSRRAKHAGYYCDVSRWRRKGTHTFLDTFRLADKIRRRLLRRRKNLQTIEIHTSGLCDTLPSHYIFRSNVLSRSLFSRERDCFDNR